MRMPKDPTIEDGLERAIEAGLREHSRSEPCPPMDVMAAYCERSLASEEVSRWEAHFAGCRRCQELLAAMARVEPAGAPANAPARWSRAFDWRWLVPATAAATAFTIWIAVRPGTKPADAPTVAVVERRESPAPPAAPSRPGPSSALQAPVPEKSQEQFAKKAEAKPAESAQAVREAADRLAKKEAPPVAAEAAGAVAGTPRPSAPAAAPAPQVTALANRESAAADTAMRRQSGVVVTAPGAQIHWRAGSGGQIERSADSGATWEAQNAGTGQELLAGSAPSDSVCWIVGRSGTILRTTDGRAWSRVESPVSADIVSVAATSGANATITTADGQRFITRDGGRTWEKQE